MPAARDRTGTRPVLWWQHAVAGMTFGLVTALAFPPVDLWPLGFFAIVPLLWSGCRDRGRGHVAAASVWLGTAPLWLFEQRWLIDVTLPGYPLVATYLAIYPAAFVWLLIRLRRTLERGRRTEAMSMAAAAPLLWVGLEVLRGEVVFTGYPWFLLGHPVIHSPDLAAPGAVIGAYGVSMLVAGLGGAIADAAGWSGVRRSRGGLAAAILVVLWAGLGWLGGHDASGVVGQREEFRVAVVQTNVPQDNKLGWTLEQQLVDWARFTELTRRAGAIRPRPDLIIWPETMVPGAWLNPEAEEVERLHGLYVIAGPGGADEEAGGAGGAGGRRRVNTWFFAEDLRRLQGEVGVPLLVGAPALEGLRVNRAPEGGLERAWKGRYNSVFLVDAAVIQPRRYDKMELTPFGELLPYVWRWPWLERMVMSVGAGGMSFDLDAGREPVVFEVLRNSGGGRGGSTAGTVGIVTPICFEATKSGLCRRLAASRAPRSGVRPSLLLNLSNDGWFGPWEGGREQHLLSARWRCVELGLPMVRAVNTGISCWIDPSGRVQRQGPDGAEAAAWTDGVMSASIPSQGRPIATVFAGLGNVVGWACLTLTLLAPLLARLAGRAPRRPPESDRRLG